MVYALCLSLDITPADTPLPLLVHDEPMLPFAREIIEATADVVTAYKINPSYYLAEGAAGVVALERIVRLLPTGSLTIWDAHATISSGLDAALMARIAFNQFGAGAVTLAHTPDPAVLDQFGAFKDKLLYAPSPKNHLAVLNEGGGVVRAYQRLPVAPVQISPAFVAVGRQILYASKRANFAEAARAAAIHWRERLCSNDFEPV